MSRTKTYSNDRITVCWNPARCAHSTVCLRRLPGVFNPARTPWIDLSAADAETIMETIDRCPSGALSYIARQSAAENSGFSQIGVPTTGSLREISHTH